jgi:hypothetical protein
VAKAVNLSSEQLAENGRKGAESRSKHSNASIFRREEKDREAIRERIQVGMLVAQLEKASKGELELSATQVAAAKILLDKALPSLQAIETSTANQWDKMSEEEIGEMVKALITSHPGLIQKLGIGLRAVEDDVQAQQCTAQTKDLAA